jgi:chemotaxis protein MotB
MKQHSLITRGVVYTFLSALTLLLAGCTELYSLREITADQDLRIRSLERKVKEKDDALTRQSMKSEADINTLSKQLRQAQEERQKALTEGSEREERLSTAYAKAQNDIKALQYDREGYKNLAEKLQAGVDQLTKDLETRKTEVDAARKETAGLKESLKKKTEEAAALDSQLKTAAAESTQQKEAMSKAQKELSDAQGKAKKLEAENQALVSMVSDQKKQLEAARSESAKGSSAPRIASGAGGDLKAAFLLLEPSFKALPPDQAKYASVTQDERGVVVRLSVDYLFKPKSVQLSQSAYPLLDHIAGIFTKYPKQYIDVEGHTDNQNVIELPFEDNWGLASERANKVLRYLTENGQIDPGRIRSSSYASSRPLPKEGGNATLERRVEILLTPNP